MHFIPIVDFPSGWADRSILQCRSHGTVGISFTTNSYLMLMAASLTRPPNMLKKVYRLRVIVDLLLCADLLLPRHWL